MRLLVVEDEARIASFIRRGLEEEHHAVDVAPDGDDAVYLATTNDYDVILLDVLLPRKNEIKRCCWRTSMGPRRRVGGRRAHTQFDAPEIRNAGFASSIIKSGTYSCRGLLR